MNENYDVAIIGGGIIGNSIAACLAGENEKLNIAVINSTNLGIPASVAAAGLLTPYQLNELENLLVKDFCLKSFKYFPKFLEQIQTENLDLGYKQCGSLYLIFSNYEIAKKENEIKEFKNTLEKVSYLNKQEVIKTEPNVSKDILGAYHFPNEGFINNPKFLKAITQYCQEQKVKFLNATVNEIKTSKSKIESILLSDNKTIQAKKYVLCNGIWANAFLKKLFRTNETIIKAIKGEILQIAAIHELPLQKILFCEEGYILPRPATNQFEKPSILIGSTYHEVNIEEGGNTFKNTISGISYLTNLLQKLLPSCKDFPVLNSWTGLRPQTKDSLPIIGRTDELENLYLALGHYRNGILMGPYTGKVLKDLILENEPEYNIKPFKIERLLKKELISSKH